MASTPLWDRLIRYVSDLDGITRYGEPIVDSSSDIDALARSGALKVRVLDGDSAITAVRTDREDTVRRLLGPLTPGEVPVVRCIGLNYKTHSASYPHGTTSLPFSAHPRLPRRE